MSSFDDELTDPSMDEATGREDPPTLDETLFDLSLYIMFNNFMKSQKASAELAFIKQARLLRLFNAPPNVYAQQAIRLIWQFFAESAKSPVKVSHEVRKKLQDIILDPEKEKTVDRDTFSLAFAEVYNAVVPLYYDWIATNEWQEAIPFHHLAPPTFNIVLTSNTLRILFNKYLNSQLDNDSDGSISSAYHTWKFCVVANDFRDGKLTHLLDSKKSKGSKKNEAASEASEKSESSTTDGTKEENPEEYAKRIHRKYKNYISLPYDSTSTYSSYIIAALNKAVAEFDKSPVFSAWLKLKQYQGVDFQAKVVHQSLNADGYVEPPTMAGVLTSSMVKFFLVMLSGREAGLNVEFIIEVLKFRTRYDPEKSASSSSDSATRKEMVEDAKRIYEKYLEPGTMYCDPRLVEEVKNTISKSSGKGVNSSLFRKCGAFIYHRCEHSWGRQARATIVWANKSYDNHCAAANEIYDEFSLSVLPEGIDLQIVPTIDDTLACPGLLRDFADFVGVTTYEAFMHFRDAYEEYFKAPPENKKPILEKVCRTYDDVAEIFPKLKPIHAYVQKEVGRRKIIADSALSYLTYTIIRAITKKYYSKWLVERAQIWKTVSWTPVTSITFSDMNSVYGMSSVERKIEEAALKGKTGLSRYFAKRAIKKQAAANARTTPAKQVTEVSSTVFSTTEASGLLYFATPRSNPDAKADAFPTPTILEVLQSIFFRRYFEAFLVNVLPAKELGLWNLLNEFYVKYSSLDDEKMADAQSEMKKEIEHICGKYPVLLKNSKELKERARKQKTVYPHFFRTTEVELFSAQYEEFAKTLRAKGWK